MNIAVNFASGTGSRMDIKSRPKQFLDDSVTGYQAVKKNNLSSKKLQKLGWKTSVDLNSFEKLIKSLS